MDLRIFRGEAVEERMKVVSGVKACLESFRIV